MKYGGHGLDNPIQETFETQTFESQRHVGTATVGQDFGVQPRPEVAQNQGHRDEHQTQPGIPRAGVNPRLPQLTVARLDAKAFAITLAHLGRTAVYPPGGEQEFLVSALATLAVAITAI